MNRILKWKLNVNGGWQKIPGTVVHIEVHEDPFTIWVWAWDSPDAADEYAVFGTGHGVPDGTYYVGTVRHQALDLVWHVIARHTAGEP